MIILSINFQLLNLCTHGMRNIGKDSNFIFFRNSYSQKFEVSKSRGARNAFQHSPPSHGRMMASKQASIHSTSPHLPMKALPSPPPPGSLNNTMIGTSSAGYNSVGRPPGAPYSQPYHAPPPHSE